MILEYQLLETDSLTAQVYGLVVMKVVYNRQSLLARALNRFISYHRQWLLWDKTIPIFYTIVCPKTSGKTNEIIQIKEEPISSSKNGSLGILEKL